MTVLSNIITPSNVLTTTNTATVTNKTFGDNPTFSGGTANGVTYLNGSKVLTSGSALTFDGTKLGIGNASPAYALQVDIATASGDLVGWFRQASNPVASVKSGSGYAGFGQGAASSETRIFADGETSFITNYLGGSEQMRLTSTGLGIGTSSPSTKLAVAGGISGTGAINISGGGWGVLPYVANSLVIDNNGGETRFFATGANATTDGSFLFYTSQTDGGANERARIDSSGNLLVGKTSSNVSVVGCELRANGAAYVTRSGSTNDTETLGVYSTGASAYRFYVGMAGTVFATNTTISAISDIRYKENVRDLDVGLNAVMALKPRLYDWKEGKGADIKNARGFIAQEFEEVFPDLIDEWKDPAPEGEAPYKSVRQDLIPVLVKAIQEQQAIIESLKARLDAANL